jgi:hypothetical protein
VTVKGARNILTALAEGCKLISVEKRIGDTAEIASMMDAFSAYAANYMYVDSAMFPSSIRPTGTGLPTAITPTSTTAGRLTSTRQ